jgi:two-component system OmpR family response regulator
MVPIKVFIVDDSAHVVEVLSELIEDVGRVTVCGSAGSARDAIDAIALMRPDVVIADLQLRDGNGFEVLEAVRADEGVSGRARPLFVVFSNHVGPELHRHALERGADHFLDKTSDHGRLLQLIGESGTTHVA